jgi:hypothetical protein
MSGKTQTLDDILNEISSDSVESEDQSSNSSGEKS